MTISELRSRFPEYRDLDDDELIIEVHESSYEDIPFNEFLDNILDKPKQDPILPAMTAIVAGLEALQESIAGVSRTVNQAAAPDYTKQFELLNDSVVALAKYIDAIKPPVVNVEAPIVNVAPPEVNVAAPVIKQQEIKMPKQELLQPVKEWDFKVKRDSNGYIQGVTAIAKEI